MWYNSAMQTLSHYLDDAVSRRVAIGHFNFSNLETLHAITHTARALSVPVIVGTSEGERNFVGVRQAVALVRSLREEFNHPVFLNADHTYSFEKVKEALDAGYDAVIFDGTERPFEENVRVTAQCVAYARRTRPEVIVEGELGFIGKSSEVHERIPTGVDISEANLTKPEEAARFVAETGIQLLAPAVGNLHGMLEGGKDPALHIERLAAIRKAAGVPLVLHGASGNTPSDIKRAIAAGVSVVHINTELRVAYRQGLVRGLEGHPDEIAPYKYLKEAQKAVLNVVEERLKELSEGA